MLHNCVLVELNQYKDVSCSVTVISSDLSYFRLSPQRVLNAFSDSSTMNMALYKKNPLSDLKCIHTMWLWKSGKACFSLALSDKNPCLLLKTLTNSFFLCRLKSNKRLYSEDSSSGTNMKTNIWWRNHNMSLFFVLSAWINHSQEGLNVASGFELSFYLYIYVLNRGHTQHTVFNSSSQLQWTADYMLKMLDCSQEVTNDVRHYTNAKGMFSFWLIVIHIQYIKILQTSNINSSQLILLTGLSALYFMKLSPVFKS